MNMVLEAASTSETSVNLAWLHGATTQNIAIFKAHELRKISKYLRNM
jgi:hypothetical protein